jgi:hypothetical protein
MTPMGPFASEYNVCYDLFDVSRQNCADLIQ